MSRNNYDDMPTRYERHGRQNRKTGLVAFLGVIITLVIIVVYLIVSPAEDIPSEAETRINEATSMIAEAPAAPAVVEPEPVISDSDSVVAEPVIKENIQVVVLDDIEPIGFPIIEEIAEPEPIPAVEEPAPEPGPEIIEEPIVEEIPQPDIIEIEEPEPVVEEIILEEEVIEEPVIIEEEPEIIEVIEDVIPEIVEEEILPEPEPEPVPEIVEEPVVEEVIPEEPEVEVIPFEEPEPEPEVVLPPEPEYLSSVPIDNKILTMKAYVVQEGESILSISAASGIEAATITSVNLLSSLDSVSSGDIIFIPNMDGKIYTMKDDDTISSIYKRFRPGCTEEELIAMNLIEDREVEPGMMIFLPKSFSKDDEGYKPVFRIPIEGEIKVSFGERYNNASIDGIIITGYSTKVSSPLDGTVVEAGRTKNEGKYVVISHSDGYKTSYYGLETVDIRKGMEISEGDVIGSISASGIFGKFSILLKVEQNGVYLNPADFI